MDNEKLWRSSTAASDLYCMILAPSSQENLNKAPWHGELRLRLKYITIYHKHTSTAAAYRSTYSYQCHVFEQQDCQHRVPRTTTVNTLAPNCEGTSPRACRKLEPADLHSESSHHPQPRYPINEHLEEAAGSRFLMTWEHQSYERLSRGPSA